MKLLHDLIWSSADRLPERSAILRGEQTASYEMLADLVRRAASGLARAGVRRGTRVGIYLPKQIEAVAAMFAASCSRAIFVPINPVLKPAQVGHILRDSGASLLVTSAERLTALSGELMNCPDLERVVLVGNQEESDPGFGAVESWESFISVPGAGQDRGIDTDPVSILYTSGSTGKPKGVVLSQRNMVSGAESVAAYLENSESDRLLAVLPFSFDYGFSQLSTAFLVGASVVLLDYLLPRDVLRAAQAYGVTGLAAVPPLWTQLANLEWPESVAKSLRYITNSGGAMPTTALERLRRSLPDTKVFLMYGLTEAFRSTFLPPDQVAVRPTSIGKAIPNAEVLVVRPDGTECAPGEPGELVHRGALVGLGYWRDPVRTAERYRPIPQLGGEIPLPDMAVWSGDTVVRDEEGFLYFVGRRDEMIKTSGYRVSPTEVEEILFGSGLVAEAVAIGVPDDTLGQVIVAVAVARDENATPTAALLEHLRKQLPSYMIPSRIEWRKMLPRNANGKIDRALVAGELVDRKEKVRG